MSKYLLQGVTRNHFERSPADNDSPLGFTAQRKFQNGNRLISMEMEGGPGELVDFGGGTKLQVTGRIYRILQFP
jgi:hypothetical protein